MYSDPDDVAMRPIPRQPGKNADEEEQELRRTRIILEQRKDEILDLLHDSTVSTKWLTTMLIDVKQDIASIRYGADSDQIKRLRDKWEDRRPKEIGE
jgi:hypothetical protein